MNYESCELCPRRCRVNRLYTAGYCGCAAAPKAARAALHRWEEPCISGTRGSGTVFFSGCTLRCCFCQNYQLSSQGFGKEISVSDLAGIFLNLQDQGAHNINLVTATQYLPSLLEALDSVKGRLSIPLVYNCGGYERLETLEALSPYIDIWLPDLKYFDTRLSDRYSQAPDYFAVASLAVRKMIELSGPPRFDGSGEVPVMTRGTIIRHMVLPGRREDSIRLLRWMRSHLPHQDYYISLLSQYTPCFQSRLYPEIHRRLTSYEYDQVVETALALDITRGYMQKKSSAKEEYTPPFDLTGIP